MTIAANVVIGVIALLHVYFLVLEMFLWDKPFGLRTFRQTLTAAQTFKVLAANQGPYRLLGGGPGGVGPEPGHCGHGREDVLLELRAGGRPVWGGHGWPGNSVCAGITRSHWAGAGVPCMTLRKFA